MTEGTEILLIDGVSKTFRQKGTKIPALVSIDLSLADGETLGLVGESGSGKSTLAKAILGVHGTDPGSELSLDDHELAARSPSAARPTNGRCRSSSRTPIRH